MYELLSYTHERDAAVKDTRRAATQEPTQGGQALTLTRLRENDGARGGGRRGASATLVNYTPNDSRGRRRWGPRRRWRLRPLPM